MLFRSIGKDGNFRVGFFSDSSGNADIWVASSADGTNWAAPIDTTGPPEQDYYPSAILGSDGLVHMTWFRAGSGPSFVGSIWYRNGTSDSSWATPKVLTGSSELNWTPTIAEANGKLWIAWAADKTPNDRDCFLVSSPDGGATWSDPPLRITDATANDDFPFIFARADESLLMVWARSPFGEPPLGAASSEIVYATSANGVTWSPRQTITDDGTLPCAFRSGDASGVSIAWTSGREDPFGEIYVIGLSEAPSPSAPKRLTTSPGKDYSPRLIATKAPEIYLMAWVSNRNGPVDGDDLDIFYQLVSTAQ